jgi:hypothetical protein
LLAKAIGLAIKKYLWITEFGTAQKVLQTT